MVESKVKIFRSDLALLSHQYDVRVNAATEQPEAKQPAHFYEKWTMGMIPEIMLSMCMYICYVLFMFDCAVAGTKWVAFLLLFPLNLLMETAICLFLLHCTVRFCSVQCLLYYTALYHSVLICVFVLHCSVLCCAIQYCTVLHCVLLYSTVLYSTLLLLQSCARFLSFHSLYRPNISVSHAPHYRFYPNYSQPPQTFSITLLNRNPYF